jgi:hypothetical protein
MNFPDDRPERIMPRVIDGRGETGHPDDSHRRERGRLEAVGGRHKKIRWESAVAFGSALESRIPDAPGTLRVIERFVWERSIRILDSWTEPNSRN